MNKTDLINALENLEVNEGFKIDSETYVFGVQHTNLMDSNTIVFAAYGGELFSYWKENFSSEEIADKIEEYMKGFDDGTKDGFLTLEKCTIQYK